MTEKAHDNIQAEGEAVTFVAVGGINYLGGWGKGKTMAEALKVAKGYAGGRNNNFDVFLVLAPNSDDIYADGSDYREFASVHFPKGVRCIHIQERTYSKRRKR